MPKRSAVFAKFHSKNMPTLSQEEYDKVIGIIAKDEAAQAEAARIALIEAKNAELDQKLAAVALRHQKTMDIANAKLKLAEDAMKAAQAAPQLAEAVADAKEVSIDVKADEALAEASFGSKEAFDEAVNERKAVIEIIATECAAVEAAHLEEYADIYNPQGAG